MRSLIRKCPNCKTYTLKEICPKCGTKTIMAIPPRFSPEDPYGRYRRELKRKVLGNVGQKV